MQDNAGFFPPTVEKIERFCELMIEDLTYVDILGSWMKHESFFATELANSSKVMLEDLEPFFCKSPWTHSLTGKKILVVHPFADTIQSQYAKRALIFPDVCILGCGAYGFPLAAHIKRQGRKAIHLGGVTQLLFGIKGRRWEHYVVYPYSNLFNEHWARPNHNETPQVSQSVEGGCYW
jgi:hypothetical protein